MEIQAVEKHAATVVRNLADEVRAELARQRLSARDLAITLDVSQHTVGRRLIGETPFNAAELIKTSAFLGLSYTELIDRATREVLAVAS